MSERVSEFWENTKRIISLSQRPTRQEIWLQFKLSMLGLFVVGAVGYFIQLILIVLSPQLGGG
ncbi:MAG: SecE/sec61-gamma family protein translocase subunit [Promethearchaeota archaeon]